MHKPYFSNQSVQSFGKKKKKKKNLRFFLEHHVFISRPFLTGSGAFRPIEGFTLKDVIKYKYVFISCEIEYLCEFPGFQ